jgi:hypothetical protein
MNLENLIRNRAFALGAGVAMGALLLSAMSKVVQGDDGGTNAGPRPQPMVPAVGTSESNGTMIAVTGIHLTGSSILNLVDTKSKHLAINQANGGAASSQGVKLVGARRIDLDLQLDGFNDKSEYTVQELEQKFSELGRSPARK